jgi:CheY-like chemotaxis protein
MTGSHHRILVVEDDPETAGQLADSLASNGNQVDVAASGGEALSRGIAGGYAVITIDRMLPDIDGIAVMRRLRDGGVAAPILIISALGEVDDRVRGLRAGGDDYLVKPFSFVELLARVEALGRRSDTVVKETVLRVGDLAMDLVSRGQGHLASSPGVPASRVFGPQRRPDRVPGNVAAARLGSPFRPDDEYHRGLRWARTSQGRWPAGLSSDPHHSGRWVLSPCSSLRR